MKGFGSEDRVMLAAMFTLQVIILALVLYWVVLK